MSASTSAAAAGTSMGVDEFGDVFEKHRDAVFNVAYCVTRDLEAAKDVTQSAFVRAFEHRAELRDVEKVRGWLVVTAANLARNHRSAQRPTEPMETVIDRPAPGPRLEDAVVAQQAADLVWSAVGSLDPHHRIALELRLRQGRNQAEVGEALGVSARRAKKILSGANSALRTAVRGFLVSRQREQCPRLTALLATAGTAYGPAERRTVDRHMRKCPACRSLADRLTRPAELFGGLMLLPAPAGLERFDPSWLDKPRPSTSAVPPATSAAARSAAGSTLRSMATAPLGLAVGGAVALLAVGGGVVAATHRGAAPASPSVVAAGSAAGRGTSAGGDTSAAAASTTTTAPTATPVATPSPTALPPDESTKSVDAIWADTLTDVRAASSYHIVYSTSDTYGDTNRFDMTFTRGGYGGTITLSTSPNTPFIVRKVGGQIYVDPASVRSAPDNFGLSGAQASQLGSAWLALATSGPQADVATLVDRAVAPFAAANNLADGIVSPTGRTHSGGTTVYNGLPVIVLSDETGSMYVTDSGQPYPVKIAGGSDTLLFSGFNTSGPVTVPAAVQHIPSS